MVALILVAACARLGTGATLLVPDDYSELDDAVRAAQANDVIRVQPKPNGEPYATVRAKRKFRVVIRAVADARPVVGGFILSNVTTFVASGFDVTGGIFVRNGTDVVFDDLVIPPVPESRIIFIGGRNNAVRDSRVDSGKTAIQFLRSSKPLIRGNQVAGAARTGILIDQCVGATVDDNVVAVEGRRAIRLADSAGSFLASNTVTAAGNGIEILRSPRTIVDSNLALRNGRDGIVVASSSDSDVSSNALVDNARFGILVALSPPIDVVSDVLGARNVFSGNGESVVVLRVRLPVRR